MVLSLTRTTSADGIEWMFLIAIMHSLVVVIIFLSVAHRQRTIAHSTTIALGLML